MKKLLMSLALVAGGFACASAQEVYAPEAGDLSTELKFTPFKSDGNTFSLPALSVRYFFTGNDALTVDLGLNGRNRKFVPDTEISKDAFEKYYYGTFSIDLGYQRHFYQYKRIDLYAGGKVGYVHQFAGSTEQVSDGNKVWGNYCEVDGEDYYTGNGFSIYATTGIDFYIYKGLYVGAELNLGFTDVFASNTCTKVTVNGSETKKESNVGGHDFKGGFDVDPRIRLGWTF